MDRVKSIQHNNSILWYDSAYQVAAPVISCTTNVVTMTCATTGATIKYSTNGGSSWSTYSSSITISATTTYVAYATKADMLDSSQVSYTATYIQTVATPSVSCTNNVVTMTCSTSGATIKYSTNGGSSWSTYSSSITISATTNYIVYATKSGMLDSSQVSYTATYVQPQLPAPSVTITNNGYDTGTYPYHFIVKCTTTGISGVTYYLKWGRTGSAPTDPTTSSYNVTGTGTGSNSEWSTGASSSDRTIYIKVIGVKSGYKNSSVTSTSKRY